MEQNSKDPVAFCIDALQNATNKDAALEQAKIAHQTWWVVDVSGESLSENEIEDILTTRCIVMATVASVYVWHALYDKAAKLEDEFLFNNRLWEGNKREVIEAYLMLLIIQKQTDHLREIFEDSHFRNNFLAYEDAYLSYLNPAHEFQSDSTEFIETINRINNFSTMLHGYKLM